MLTSPFKPTRPKTIVALKPAVMCIKSFLVNCFSWGTHVRKRAKNDEVESTGDVSTQSGSVSTVPSGPSNSSGGATPVKQEVPAVATPSVQLARGASTWNLPSEAPALATPTDAAQMTRGASTLAHSSSFEDRSNEGTIAKARVIRQVSLL